MCVSVSAVCQFYCSAGEDELEGEQVPVNRVCEGPLYTHPVLINDLTPQLNA